jgi:hypothetical protein
MTAHSSNPGKLWYPTVETCPHRRASSVPGDARCELVRQIVGVDDPGLCAVGRDACRACCESFPPTSTSWNPVIASLVLDLADEVASRGGVAGCSADRAIGLRRTAEAALDVADSKDGHLQPARSGRPCCFLGLPIRGEAEAADDAVRSCRHPGHATTTLEQCRMCPDWSLDPPISRFLSAAEMVPPPSRRSGTRVCRWSVAVTTAPRRESTLEWCLESVIRAGWELPHLYLDGLVRVPDRYGHLPVTWRERPVGAWPNWYLALMEMIQRDPKADAYLLLQDDAVLFDRVDLREYLETVLWPGDRPGIVSLFCSQAYNRTQPGWHALAEPWVWGALAFVFPRELAIEFVIDPAVVSHRWTGIRDGRVQIDVLVGRWAASRGCPVWYPNPSLAQHVGNTSSLWQDARAAGLRKADWFAGDLEAPFAHETSLSDFPEHRFPCREEHRPEYRRRIELGRTRMARRRLVIAGLCRSVRHFLPRLAARVERLGAQFREYRVVLFENDSDDATLEFLLDWRRRDDRVHVLSERLGHFRYPQIRAEDRAWRMAEYRNRYRRFVLEHFGDFDDLLVTDTDLAGGWSYEGLANTIGQDDWDFVGSYGLQRAVGEHGGLFQFDAWAFRAHGHPEPHANVEVNLMVLDRGEPMLPVLSCFGGMGVYRMEAMRSAEYGGPDIEHATLHTRMRQGGFDRLFLNPSQIVLYSPE